LESYLPLITGGTGAVVVMALWVYAFYSGKIHSDREFSKLEQENTQLRAENTQLRAAVETERKTVDETASAGQVTNQLISALTAIAAGRKAAPRGDLTAEDLGL